MFAVIKTGGKQYRVAEKDVITIDKVKGAPGDLVEFGEVLILGGDNVMVGTPTVAGASVAGEVVEQTRGAKVIAFKKRRRKNSRRKRGHRQELSVIRITEILTDGRKPSPRAQASEEAPAQEAAAEPATDMEVEAEAPAEAGASETAEAKPARKRARRPAAAKSADED
ncbi:MAG: 50S ribosomal protein L21 [Hyphomicrobiales bacterium]|nr:50S ribosomal protein L21 [Hyphomicrobiales bacterium]MBV8825993.1 50S ribosomal protein L21 [Hyphomicrobiales bacterium]MBV9428520.1 50S ribosomal protein L21 [Bradyrhizobiaceae bacterium]